MALVPTTPTTPSRLNPSRHLEQPRELLGTTRLVQIEKVGDHRTQLRQRNRTDVAAATVFLDPLDLDDGQQVAWNMRGIWATIRPAVTTMAGCSNPGPLPAELPKS